MLGHNLLGPRDSRDDVTALKGLVPAGQPSHALRPRGFKMERYDTGVRLSSTERPSLSAMLTGGTMACCRVLDMRAERPGGKDGTAAAAAAVAAKAGDGYARLQKLDHGENGRAVFVSVRANLGVGLHAHSHVLVFVLCYRAALAARSALSLGGASALSVCCRCILDQARLQGTDTLEQVGHGGDSDNVGDGDGRLVGVSGDCLDVAPELTKSCRRVAAWLCFDDGREKESEELEVLTHEHEGRVGEDMYGTGKYSLEEREVHLIPHRGGGHGGGAGQGSQVEGPPLRRRRRRRCRPQGSGGQPSQRRQTCRTARGAPARPPIGGCPDEQSPLHQCQKG